MSNIIFEWLALVFLMVDGMRQRQPSQPFTARSLPALGCRPDEGRPWFALWPILMSVSMPRDEHRQRDAPAHRLVLAYGSRNSWKGS